MRCMSGELWSCCASSADVGTTESASMASVKELPTKSSRLCSWESEGMRGIEEDVARPDDMARGAPRGVEGPAPVPSVAGKSCRLGVSRESQEQKGLSFPFFLLLIHVDDFSGKLFDFPKKIRNMIIL